MNDRKKIEQMIEDIKHERSLNHGFEVSLRTMMYSGDADTDNENHRLAKIAFKELAHD